MSGRGRVIHGSVIDSDDLCICHCTAYPPALSAIAPLARFIFPLCETLRERLYSIKAITWSCGGYAIASCVQLYGM